MFGFFKRGLITPAVKPSRKLPLLCEFDDHQLIVFLLSVFDGKNVTAASLYLVAHENLNTWFTVFCRHPSGPAGKYPATLEGMAQYLARSASARVREYPATLDGIVAFFVDSHAQFSSDSIEDEYNCRRYFYLYMAALLCRVHLRAKEDPRLWDAVAEVWIRLLEGGRALRMTLDRTSLWLPDEVEYFAGIHNEDQGERYVESIMMPAEIRYHEKIEAWRDRYLTPEQRAVLDADMMRLFGSQE